MTGEESPIAVLPAELHLFPERHELALVYKQKHTDNFQLFVSRLAGLLWLNRYDASGQRCCLPSVEEAADDAPEEAEGRMGEPWTITIDLSRNFFDVMNLSQLVSVVWQRMVVLAKDSKVPEDVRGVLWQCHVLESLEAFASCVTVICMTSNVLRSFPVLGDLKLEKLEKLLLNHNHIPKLDDAQSLARFCPHLQELDLRHNQIAGPLRLKPLLGDMSEMKV